MAADSIEILMIEDNPGDIELTRQALIDGRLKNNFHIVEDGEAALDFLYARGKYQACPKPDLILLDLNLPKLNGREVLADIKSNNDLLSIPVVILSSSDDAEDIQEAYSLNAHSFVTKPFRMEDLLKVVKSTDCLGINIVKLPISTNQNVDSH